MELLKKPYRKLRTWMRTITKRAIHPTAIVRDRKFVSLAKNAEIQEYVVVRAFGQRLTIGENSQLNPFTVVYVGEPITIGKNVMIAPHCMLVSADHDFKQTDVPMRFAGSISKGPIVIEDGAWVGANSVILSGVTIGHDALVAAGSVVTHSVMPFDIVAGVPARKIGNRKTA